MMRRWKGGFLSLLLAARAIRICLRNRHGMGRFRLVLAEIEDAVVKECTRASSRDLALVGVSSPAS